MITTAKVLYINEMINNLFTGSLDHKLITLSGNELSSGP